MALQYRSGSFFRDAKNGRRGVPFISDTTNLFKRLSGVMS